MCFGTERILVHEKIKETFLKHLAETLKSHHSAGHSITCDGAQRAHNLIREAVADGAEILMGENQLTNPSSLQPSIITDINSSSRINNEEVFGPSASFSTFTTDEEAVEVANNTSFGLSASIFTKDYARALKMARELEYGQVQVNAWTLHVNSTAPVTGYKSSGWGSNGGGYGVGEFMFNKHICLCP